MRNPNTIFTSLEIRGIFDAIVGKTLEQVDKYDVFSINSNDKGIAGHIIEKSVLGYELNSEPEPDIEIDGIDTEVKTTGMKKSGNLFVAKEPMSVTGVFINEIVNEEFERSHFWLKARQMLLVYYFYDYKGPYDMQQYRRFIIEGYELRVISKEDRNILESDWTTIRDFLREVQVHPNPEEHYPELSHIRLMYLDIAPKYPKKPRFRFRRAYVNSFIQEHFYGVTQTELPFIFDKYSQFDDKCSQITKQYNGMSVTDLLQHFKINVKETDKSILEKIVLKMFHSDADKINSIGIFNKLGIIGKTLVQDIKDDSTEEMKLFKIDFDEIRDLNLDFEESQFYSYFRENQFLIIVFKEQTKRNVKFTDNKFVGFKRVSFSDDFIEREVKPVWLEIRRLVNNNELKEVFTYKKDGTIRLSPKTKLPVSAPNFPKPENHLVFVRGSGKNKSKCPLEINGIKMYSQYLWIRGDDMVEVVKGNRIL